MNRLELLAETLRAALNELAAVAPEWLRGRGPGGVVRAVRPPDRGQPPARRARRNARRTREAVGEDGFTLLDRLDGARGPGRAPRPAAGRGAPPGLGAALRRDGGPPGDGPGAGCGCRPEGELPPAAEGIESPYDPEARYRSKSGMHWTGYAAILTETCDEDRPHLITHVATTTAAVHEVNCTAAIQQALVGLGLPPGEHLVDAGYVTAELLVSSREEHGIRLVGPPRKDASWQNRTEGAYGVEHFAIDWEREQVRCPQGRPSASWKEYTEPERGPYVSVRFRASDCRDCPVRPRCTRAAKQGRYLRLPPRAQYEALREMRSFIDSEEGRRLYAKRAGIEGTISQGVRSFGLRRARYRGQAKAHLQHVATAVAMNFSRVSDWLEGVPRAATRMSRFARLVA